MISFTGNFQVNNILFYYVQLYVFLYPQSYIVCTEMAITEFLLFVLTATLGGMFFCGANDLITIFLAPKCSVYAPTYYQDIPREMYSLMRLL